MWVSGSVAPPTAQAAKVTLSVPALRLYNTATAIHKSTPSASQTVFVCFLLVNNSEAVMEEKKHLFLR